MLIGWHDVSRSGRRRAHQIKHSAEIAVWIPTLADIVLLRTKCYLIHRQSVARIKTNLFSVFAQLEIGVQIGRRAGDSPVVRPDEEISARGNRRSGRESPLLLLAKIIGQVEAGEIDGRRAKVVELNPVFVLARRRIDQVVGIGGKPLVDDHRHR